LPHLDKDDYQFNYKTFYSVSAYGALYKKGKFIAKTLAVISGFIRRFSLLFTLSKYDYVFIQREITPIGPAFFEWCISRFFNLKMIYDFDDAIWLPNYSKENALFHRLKNYGKIKRIIRWSDEVVAGNKYLYDYAIQFNANTRIIPTVIDTVFKHNPSLYEKKENDSITVGWTGTLTNNLHIEYLTPVFEKLNKKYQYDILLISNKKPDIPLPNVRFEEWNKENEIEQLFQADIGLMPLRSDEDFYLGKCGFKAIQYMSLGITTVATPLGFNKDLIQDYATGYFASSLEDWYNILEKLILAKEKNLSVSMNARKHVEDNFSVKAQLENIESLFN